MKNLWSKLKAFAQTAREQWCDFFGHALPWDCKSTSPDESCPCDKKCPRCGTPCAAGISESREAA